MAMSKYFRDMKRLVGEAVNWLAGVQVLPAKVDADGKSK